MNFNISYELKLEILNAVKKRNEMFAKWIEHCSTIAFLMVATIALINITSLKIWIFNNNQDLMDAVTIFTIIVSLCFDFIFKSEKYKNNLRTINCILENSCDKAEFDKSFMKNIALIKEIDVARARYDYSNNLKVHNLLSTQSIEDRLQPVDLVIINRERYIIIVLIAEIILFVGLLVFATYHPMLLYILPLIMVILGVMFMIIDGRGNKRAEKQIQKMYY